MSLPRTEILALGEAMIEYNQTAPDGADRLWLQGHGGDTSNVAIAAARQGARTGYVTRIGDDTHGRLLRELWQREGVDDRDVRTIPDAETGVYFVRHDAEGHRFEFLRRHSAATGLVPGDLPGARIAAARVLHLSGISMAISTSAETTCRAAIAQARAAGTWVSFDTNLRPRLAPIERQAAAIAHALGQCDICLPGRDDLRLATGLEDPDAMVDHCLRAGARIVALKMGADGALVATADARWRVPPHPCRPVDATGAGDTFDGAFLARLVAGDTAAVAAHHAACAAALATEGHGAVDPIPRAADVRAALARHAQGIVAEDP